MARSTIHYSRRGPDGAYVHCGGKQVNAYVRLGNPSRWYSTGTVCCKCGEFQFDSDVPPGER